MSHTIATLLLLLAVSAGCSNLTRKDKPRVDQKDTTQVVDSGTRAGPPATVTQIVEMFRKVFYGVRGCSESCRERAREELRALMKSAPDDVAAAALEILADPESKTDQGVGQEAMLYVDDWLRTVQDEDTRQRASTALEKVLAEGNDGMRSAACAYLGEYRLPNARRILIGEVENPARDFSERGSAGSPLGRVIDDFSLIRTWLLDDQPVHWLAALNMLSTFDQDGKDGRWLEQRALVIALGKRAVLPGSVVDGLAHFYGLYLEDDPNDPEIRPLAERWTNHPDDMAAAQMRKILIGYTNWRPPPRP